MLTETSDKRKWSVINPGIRMAQAYVYFVFAQEKGLFAELGSNFEQQILDRFKFEKNDQQPKTDKGKIVEINYWDFEKIIEKFGGDAFRKTS
jgi:hypothetical protein